MNKSSRIHVAGHGGLVGSALVRGLRGAGYDNLLLRRHSDLDLEQQSAVEVFFAREKPEHVFLAAARVGGIHANSTYPVDFLLRNLRIQNNVIEAAHRHGVKGLLFLGSSCIYPKLAPQPIKEEYLLTGNLEPTNEPYAVAKVAGIELCEAFNRQFGTRFLSVMPTNLYGPGDNYDIENSHVLPALIRKFHLGKLASVGDFDGVLHDEEVYGRIPDEFATGLVSIARASGYGVPDRFAHLLPNTDSAPSVRLWGTGSPRREFLYSDDLASACIFLMERVHQIFDSRKPSSTPCRSHATAHLYNIGCGQDVTIRELAEMVARIVGYDGAITWDSARPDGTPRKLLDVTRLKEMGWSAGIDLEKGIRPAYEDYLARLDPGPGRSHG